MHVPIAVALMSVFVLFWIVIDQPVPATLGCEASTVMFTLPLTVDVIIHPPPSGFLVPVQNAVSVVVS